MKKLILALLLVLGLVVVPAAFAGVVDKAQDLAKDKLVVGVDYTYTKASLKGDDAIPTRSMVTNSYLATIGYKLSEFFTPYGIIGSTFINEQIKDFGLKYKDSNDLTWGFGANGKVIDLPQGAVLSYDVNRKAYNSIDKDSGLKLGNGEWNTSLIVSKEIAAPAALKIKSVTPYVGYQYTNLTQKVRGYGLNNISTTNNLNSCIFGAKVALTSSIDAKIGGQVGQEQGVTAGLSYKF